MTPPCRCTRCGVALPRAPHRAAAAPRGHPTTRQGHSIRIAFLPHGSVICPRSTVRFLGKGHGAGGADIDVARSKLRNVKRCTRRKPALGASFGAAPKKVLFKGQRQIRQDKTSRRSRNQSILVIWTHFFEKKVCRFAIFQDFTEI